MPDHAHVLACGTEDGSDLQVFATAFKSATAYRYRARADRRLWQPGYFERVLRSEEATDTVARYILENPIRAGLARLVGEYPFAGSFVHDATALLDLWRDGTRD